MVPVSKVAIQIHAPAVQAATTTVGSGATNFIDTLGYDYAIVDCHLSTTDNATNNPSALNLMEADVTNSSSFATISGYVGDTDFTIATMSTSVTSIYRFGVDCRSRKRYLKLTCIPLTTQDITVIANLFRAEQMPKTAALAGVNNYVGL
jgi:hypothetical protein